MPHWNEAKTRVTPRAQDRSLLVFGAGVNQVPVLRASREAGWRTIVVDRDPEAPGASLADRFVCLSLRDGAGIDRSVAGDDFSGVVARITDRDGLAVASSIARSRGLAAPCEDLVRASTNKCELAAHCARLDIRTPERIDIASRVDFSDGPVLVRPAVSIRGKAGIRRAATQEVFVESVREATAASADGDVDVSRWIDGADISVLARFNLGRSTRLAIWDEWVAIDPNGRIHGVGVGMPSLGEKFAEQIDDVLGRLAKGFPESESLVAVSLRITSAGEAFLIEIHLGIGGDEIADKLLPTAIPGWDAFDAFVSTQAGVETAAPSGGIRPTGLIRGAEAGWTLIEADDVMALHARCSSSIAEEWEIPHGLGWSQP